MNYYFVKGIKTDFGPLHVAVAVPFGKSIKWAVEQEAQLRRISVEHTWKAREISEREAKELMGWSS